MALKENWLWYIDELGIEFIKKLEEKLDEDLKIKEKSHQECYPLATLIEISYLLINFNLSEFRITHMLLITIAIAQYTGVILIQYFSNIPIAIGIIQIL